MNSHELTRIEKIGKFCSGQEDVAETKLQRMLKKTDKIAKNPLIS
jgi:hypothetical protein